MMTGSFNPIDVGEWSEQAYHKQVEQFFKAVAVNDIEYVRATLVSGFDVDQRDAVGRTSLHLAIISGAKEVACELISSGARISARLLDGRSALHLAASAGQFVVIEKLMERSISNSVYCDVQALPHGPSTVERSPTPASSSSDWHHGDGSTGDQSDDLPREAFNINTNSGGVLEHDVETPDVLDVDEVDWDLGLTPLAFATLCASASTVSTLLKYGADPNKATASNAHGHKQWTPIFFTVIRDDEHVAAKVVRSLLEGGASASLADENLFTVFHYMVETGKVKLAHEVLQFKPFIAQTLLNAPGFQYGSPLFPIVIAVQNKAHAMTALLLAYGASLSFTNEHIASFIDPR